MKTLERLDLNKLLMVIVASAGIASTSFFRSDYGSANLSSEESELSAITLDSSVNNGCDNSYHLMNHKGHLKDSYLKK